MRAYQDWRATVTIAELRWGHIPLVTKKLCVRLLLKDGYTREAIGAFFGTTKNAVVGFQHTHLPKLTGKKVGTKHPVTVERLEELLTGAKRSAVPDVNPEPPVEQLPVPPAPPIPEPAAPAPKPEPVPVRASVKEVRPKLAASEATQCEHEDEDHHRCAYEWSDPDTKRCKSHPLKEAR